MSRMKYTNFLHRNFIEELHFFGDDDYLIVTRGERRQQFEEEECAADKCSEWIEVGGDGSTEQINLTGRQVMIKTLTKIASQPYAIRGVGTEKKIGSGEQQEGLTFGLGHGVIRDRRWDVWRAAHGGGAGGGKRRHGEGDTAEVGRAARWERRGRAASSAVL